MVTQYSKEKFMLSLKNFNADDNIKSDILIILREVLGEVLDTHDKNTGVFRSAFKRQNYFKKNPKYIQPIQINILDTNGTPTQLHYFYVPVLKTLQVMFLDKNIMQYCNNPPENREDGGLFDLSDGSIIKNNEFFQINKKALKLLYFQDAFEVCNPLGPSKTKFKLVGLYFMLMNISPHLRSKTENIKLVQLFYEKHVKEIGWSEILKTVISDLSILDVTGIDIFLPDKVANFVGTIAVVCGDNLGSNGLGGFIESFTTGHCCRQCEVSMKDFKSNVALKTTYD